MTDIVIYTRDHCGYCTAAKGLLQRRGLAYVEKDAGADPEARAEMIERSNGRMTFPQIFIGETHVGGCDDLFAMHRSGELDRLLAGNAA